MSEQLKAFFFSSFLLGTADEVIPLGVILIFFFVYFLPRFI